MAVNELVIVGVGIPPYSIRGVRQTLEHIDQASQVNRTINGGLLDMSNSAMQKYQSTISCSDQQPPAVDKRWPGRLVTVHCVAELALELPDTDGTEDIEGTDSVLGRDAVPGSVRREGDFLIYRPILEMRITGFSLDKDEWGAITGWSMQLEEA